MNWKYLYLVIDFGSIILPFLFSFYPKARFSDKWKYLWLSTLLPGLFFLIWDAWFTRLGVWGFNPAYLSGTYLLNLPVEEVLFFICIPYACVFTYEAINYLIPNAPINKYYKAITWTLVIVLGILASLFYDRWYTVSTFSLTALFLLYLLVSGKASYLSHFYFSFIIILVPFFIVNGILTGTGIPDEVVWYNNAENLGIRMGTIPVEDTFYGMLLLAMNISLFEHLQRKDKKT